jgi:glycosyltransferase involved in cell wall biosynthesis
MRPRRFLIVTYYFPPRPTIGGLRWAAMSKWLRRMGHEVTVLTSRLGAPPNACEPGVVRTFDLAERAAARRLLARAPVAPIGEIESVHSPAPRWVTDTVAPDEFLFSWVTPAFPRFRSLVRDGRFDCIVTSGPPHSTHLLPVALGRERPAWIVDLRDGWRMDSQRRFFPGLQRVDARLECRLGDTADHVIGATLPIAEDIRARLAAQATYVPNGWDPSYEPKDSLGALETLRVGESGGFDLVYTGGLSGPTGRDPRCLFDALKRFAVERPDKATQLRLVVAGVLSAHEVHTIESLDLGVSVVHVGSVTRDVAITLQRRADALVLLTSPSSTSEATGKIYEYLAAGRPILTLAHANEAARIVAETRAGIVVHPHDVGGIVRALASLVDGTINWTYAPGELSRYTYPRPAEQVVEIVEHLLARRVRHKTGVPA